MTGRKEETFSFPFLLALDIVMWSGPPWSLSDPRVLGWTQTLSCTQPPSLHGMGQRGQEEAVQQVPAAWAVHNSVMLLYIQPSLLQTKQTGVLSPRMRSPAVHITAVHITASSTLGDSFRASWRPRSKKQREEATFSPAPGSAKLTGYFCWRAALVWTADTFLGFLWGWRGTISLPGKVLVTAILPGPEAKQ